MTDDVIFMVPRQKPFGQQAFATASKGMKNVRIEGTSEVQEIQASADWASLRTTLNIGNTARRWATLRRSGYTLTVLHRNFDGRLPRDANLLAEAK
jgi:ketosteroid isomerase-like protein